MSRPSELKQEVVDMFNAGLSVTAITEETGWKRKEVEEVLTTAGLLRAKSSLDEEAIVKMYRDGERISTIATTHQIHFPTIYKILDKHKVTYRSTSKEDRQYMLDIAVTMYQNGETIFRINLDTNVSVNSLYKELLRLEIPLRRHTTPNTPNTPTHRHTDTTN